MDSASDTAKLSKLDCLQVGYGIFLPGYYSVMLGGVALKKGGDFNTLMPLSLLWPRTALQQHFT
jgi:hypothetical protein